MAEGYDIHQQRSGKKAKESTLQDHCRAAVLGATGIENAEDLTSKLNLPATLISFLTKQFGSDDFFVNSNDVTAEDISTETYNAICTTSKQSVMLKCMCEKLMRENSEYIKFWTNKELKGIQKYLSSFNERQKCIYVLQGDLKNLKKVVDDMKCNKKQAEECSVWALLKKLVDIVRNFQDNQSHYKDMQTSKISLDKSGDVWLYNPIIYMNGNANNDPFTLSQTGLNAIYTSPEVISGDEPTIKSTIWALGCILYEVAMQRPAFTTDGSDIFASLNDIVEGKKPENLHSSYSKELQDVIWSCLRVQKHERPNLEMLLTTANEQLKNKASDLKGWLE